jgi:hypothetical protein
LLLHTDFRMNIWDPTSSVPLHEHLAAINARGEAGVEEVLVVAIGKNSQYYICWKTQDGEYKQSKINSPRYQFSVSNGPIKVSNGLQPKLQEWLFPPDGTTRDFESLRVILGQGDEFHASDKAGKISHVDQLSRSRVMSQMNPTLRERASTLPAAHAPRQLGTMLDETAEPATSSSQESILPWPKLPAAEATTPDRKVKTSSQRPRPISWMTSTSGTGRSRQSSVGGSESTRSSTYSMRSLTSMSSTFPSPSYNELSCRKCEEFETRKRNYTDAAVQTVPESVGESMVTKMNDNNDDIVEIQPDAAPVPVSAGQMGTYFRSSEYRLGDFFRARRNLY